MFDQTYLPPAIHEFVVIADSHYMLDTTNQSVEFDSRRRQTVRADHALRVVKSLGIEQVIHMGDLVQEFPERPGFAQAMQEAQEQLAAAGVAPRFVAGNHDVGDKPDPTMPADWVKAEYLDDFHRRFGPSWQSWDEAGLHFVIFNSQILNSGLPAEAEQAAWLEADLRGHVHQRMFLFLHLPPFLHNTDETALGHYDNIDEPARSWLLALVRQHPVEMLFAAHVHWIFYNEIESYHPNISRTAFFTTPSPAFTRPGFSQLFASPPPPEQGRDDAGKLGFYLVRVLPEGSRVHFVRTGGQTGAPDPRARLLTRTSPDLPDSPLGVLLHHPLSNQAETPSIWPSFVRQPVRNDYPLLACTELGVRQLLVPLSDIVDPVQRERLGILRRQGVKVTARVLWRAGLSLVGVLAGAAEHCDGVQVDLTGNVSPDPALARVLGEWSAAFDLPITLSCVVPGRSVVGKQHNRAQVGFLPGDLPLLGEWLQRQNLTVERVLCRLNANNPVISLARQMSIDPLPTTIGAVDWIVELPATGTGRRLNAAAELLFVVASQPGSRLFFEPLIELDRTMDVAEGLLDRLCNPAPVFHLLRHLNTLLFSQPWPTGPITETESAGGRLLSGIGPQKQVHIFLPETTSELHISALGINGDQELVVYDLLSGHRLLHNHRVEIEKAQIEKGLPSFAKPGNPKPSTIRFDGPTLLISPPPT